MNFEELKAKDKTYIAGTYNRVNLAVVSGKESQCDDIAGENFVDFSSGVGVNSLGFANESWANAVKAQVDKLNHMSNIYYTIPQVELAEKLCKLAGMKKVFFCNSGAEANEGAIKAARKYSSDKYGEGRHEIITLKNSFHGRTIATLSATGQEAFHQHFGPFVEGFLYADANDLDSIKNLVGDKTAAIMVECIQGEGGVIPLEADFLESIGEICKEKDILLIVDEVQTGAGRTGTFLCSQQYEISPDIITMAKGLGGGLPIGAVLFGEKTKNTLGISDHATTFGGNPIVAAGAIAVLDTLTDDFLKQVNEKAEYLFAEFSKIPEVEEISGKGLMLGIKLKEGLTAREVVEECAKNGLILLTAKEKLRALPPLNISQEQMEKGIEILKQSISSLERA